MGDKTMKRRLTVILLSLTLIFTLMPATVFAVSDVTEPVSAASGQHKTVGNVTVNDATYGVEARAEDASATDKDASVKVNGNVKLTTQKNSPIAVAAYSDAGKGTVEITGNVAAEVTGSGDSKAVYASKGTVKVGGDVSITKESTLVTAVENDYGNIQVGGDVTVDCVHWPRAIQGKGGYTSIGGNVTCKGGEAFGIQCGSNLTSNCTVKVDGQINVETIENYYDHRRAAGIMLDSGNVDITVGKGIKATAPVTDGESIGIELDTDAGIYTIDVTGDVEAKSDEGKAEGIRLRASDCIPGARSTALIHGDVVSDGAGILGFMIGGVCSPADILVEGEIKAKIMPVVLGYLSDEVPNSNMILTVWKTQISEDGNIVGCVNLNTGIVNSDAATDFEKNNIKYIIKYKQPSKGGTLYAVNSSGNALEKSHGYRVAKEGDKIIVKANLDSGWKLKSVYDNGKALKKDDNGNFYLTVHKGGGILLSADLEEPGSDPTQMGSDGTAVGEGASAAAAEQKITGMKTDTDPKGSKFNKLRLRSTYQTKTSITLKWKSNKKAAKYVIYGNRCGTSTKIRKSVKLYTVKKSSKTTMTKVIKKVKGAAVKKNTYYKFLVVALNKNNKVVSTSRMIHVATKGGKYTNYKSISVKKDKITKAKNLKKGKSLKLEPTQVKVSKSLEARKHVAIRYESTNKNIAKVTSKGVIKALKKGTCYVYVYAQNGVYKKIKVVVK